jgi:hypothetical protein
MPELPIPFPQNGVSDTFSYEAQPPGTSVDALNVRSVDSVTGRVRGAQREGLARLTDSTLSGGNKVQALTSVTYDGRTVVYNDAQSSVRGDLTDWEKALNSDFAGGNSGVYITAIDSERNVYTVVGNALLVKYNSGGAKLWEYDLPVGTANHIVRTLTVDEYGTVFVGVSEGTTGQHLAWARAYNPNAETYLSPLWKIETNGYVERILLKGDKAYLSINDSNAGRSRIEIYTDIYSFNPTLTRSWAVPYPVNDCAINEDNELVSAHDFREFDNRSYDPRYPDATYIVDPEAQRWNPTMLPQWEDRRWCWLDASQIPSQPGQESIKDGDDVTVWSDSSGRGQVRLKSSTVTGDKAPTFYKTGFAGKSAVRFSGNDYRLESDASIGAGPSNDDSQKTIAPGTKGYLMVMVAKLGTEYATPSALFYQDNYWWPSEDSLDDFFCWPELGSNNPAAVAHSRLDHVTWANGTPQVRTDPWNFVGGTTPTYFNYNTASTDFLRFAYVNDLVIARETKNGLVSGVNYWILSKHNSSPFASYGDLVRITASQPTGANPAANTNTALATTGSGNQTVNMEWRNYGLRTSNLGTISINAESFQNRSPYNTTYYPDRQYSLPRDAVGRFDNSTGMAIITVMRDNEDCDAGFDVSQFRVNGVPLSQWQGLKFATSTGRKSVIGKIRSSDSNDLYIDTATNALGLEADIYEIFVIRRYTDGDDNKKKICTFPNYNSEAIGTNPAYDSASDTELERIEGYFAWKYGLSHLLDKGTGTADTSALWTATNRGATSIGVSEYAHPFGIGTVDGVRNAPPNANGKAANALDTILWTSPYPMMAKWNLQRGPRWAIAETGVGYGVATYEDKVYSIGPSYPSGSDGATVRAFEDDGSSATALASFKMSISGGPSQDYIYKTPRAEVDQYGTFWMPAFWDAQDLSSWKSVYAFSIPVSGTQLLSPFSYQVGSTSFNGPYTVARCVAVDKASRTYEGSTITFPEAIALGTVSTTDAATGSTHQPTLHHIDLVESQIDGAGKSRSVTWVGVSNGNICKFTNGTVTSIATGVGALSPISRFVNVVTAFSKVYFGDGRSYKVYDPKTNVVSDWIATTSGSIPEACRLMSFWRGRMILARGAGDPFNWHMSAVGDPNDWDQFPPDSPLETQAISGNNSVVGGNHDIINALIPYDRERLIIGGDHSIHMMWGDPMAGGVISLLSDVTGISFGTGWCKDSSGTLYFYGSRGGVYAMAPGGYADRISNHPQRISTQTIDRRLSEVNLETHYLGMVWDDIEQMLHLYQMPYGTNTQPMNNWCWEKKTGSWWIDRFADVGLSPTALAVMDGDAPGDRTIAIGCQDGYVRYPSRTATTDDGFVINSYVTIGPIFSGTNKMSIRDPKFTLARDQGGCWVELLASDTPDVPGETKAAAMLWPGQNPKMRIGARGAYCWVRLRNAAVGQRWAYESGVVNAIDVGRRTAP